MQAASIACLVAVRKGKAYHILWLPPQQCHQLELKKRRPQQVHQPAAGDVSASTSASDLAIHGIASRFTAGAPSTNCFLMLRLGSKYKIVDVIGEGVNMIAIFHRSIR